MKDLVELETNGWHALARRGDAARDFYASVLKEDAVMLFPGGLRIEGRERILESLGDLPWESFLLEEVRVIRITDAAASVVYRVNAQRRGSPSYCALVSSTYVDDQGWKLLVHQHTPV